MLNRILGFLGGSETADSSSGGLERIQVATCVLLLELAHADSHFQEMEVRLVKDLMQEKFSLSREATEELLALAQRRREESFDLFQHVQQINEHFSREEKLEIVDVLWRIVYADGVLDMYEDALMRQLTTLLRISPKEMIASKLKILEESRKTGA